MTQPKDERWMLCWRMQVAVWEAPSSTRTSMKFVTSSIPTLPEQSILCRKSAATCVHGGRDGFSSLVQSPALLQEALTQPITAPKLSSIHSHSRYGTN